MLSINLKGKKVFIAGIGDDQGYGWAIAKALAEAGALLFIGVWPPILKIFTASLNSGKFDASRKLSDGSLMNFEGIFPLDASFDSPDEVPQEIRENKRYKEIEGYTLSEAAKNISEQAGQIDVVIHSLANAPEIQKPLLETSRKGYLTAIGTSTYSLISLISHFGPHMSSGGSFLSLTYIAGEKVIPGYGGGMSSAKAALESDTQTLAWEAGRKWGLRVNTISAGPLGSRAAKAIGFIDHMIAYSHDNAPIQKDLKACEIGNTAAFLVSSLASAITGSVIYVDNGLNIMGAAMQSSMKSIASNEEK